jgi:hypothetical protein
MLRKFLSVMRQSKDNFPTFTDDLGIASLKDPERMPAFWQQSINWHFADMRTGAESPMHEDFSSFITSCLLNGRWSIMATRVQSEEVAVFIAPHCRLMVVDQHMRDTAHRSITQNELSRLVPHRKGAAGRTGKFAWPVSDPINKDVAHRHRTRVPAATPRAA